MKRRILLGGVVVIFLLGLFVGVTGAEAFSTTPSRKPDGSKWRVGYIQGGVYKDYMPVTLSLVRGLMELGWIERSQPPQFDPEVGSKALWEWLSKPDRSRYINFVEDAFYSSDWDSAKREKTKEALINRLNGKKDIDLMLALGTWAGQDLTGGVISTPTLVLSTSDPLSSNIVKNVELSGYEYLWARLDPTRYERQVALFHDIIGFKKLGLVYENTTEGRSYASIDKVEKVARMRGFEIVPCFASFSKVSEAEAAKNVIACHEQLAPKVDALYITHHRGIQPKHMNEIMKPLFKHNVPTFSQPGSDEVRRGALMSISQANFLYVGKYYAETVAKALNGAKPGELNQVFESPPKIAINLETAERIGYDPPVDILGAADEIYENIEQANP